MYQQRGPPMISPENVRYIVFAGGGQRAFSYIGALHYLNLPSKQLAGVGGTSMGALIACLVAAKYTPQEIADEVLKTSISEALDLNLATVFTNFGLDRGVILGEYIDALLRRKSLGGSTFGSLKLTAGIELTVVAHDLHANKSVYFSPNTTPHIAVKDGVVASMALPPLFAPQRMDSLLLIDWGCVDNFPMAQFPAKQTLGMRVMWDQAHNLDTVANYCSRVVYCALSRGDLAQWESLDEEHRKNTLTINVGDMPVVEWSSRDKFQKNGLLRAGFERAQTVFSSNGT